MTHDEMRLYRRDLINSFLHLNYALCRQNRKEHSLHEIMSAVREYEFVNYGYELSAYKNWSPT